MAMNTKIDNFLDNLARDLFGRTKNEAQSRGVCTWCGEVPGKFKDEISEKEYAITGFCQECQDKVFGEEED